MVVLVLSNERRTQCASCGRKTLEQKNDDQLLAELVVVIASRTYPVVDRPHPQGGDMTMSKTITTARARNSFFM